MKQTTKITLLSIWSIIATIIIVISTILLGIKFAWRIAPNFSLCEDPYKICPTVQRISRDHVKLSTTVAGIGFFYEGRTYKWVRNEDTSYTLYVGVKYIPFLGTGGGPSASIFIPRVVEVDQPITKIIACGHGKERVIYDRSVDGDRHEFQKGD